MRKSWSLGLGLAVVLAAVALLVPQGPSQRIGISERAPLAPRPGSTSTPASAPAALPGGSAAFIPNQGQWDHPASYVAQIGAGTVFVEDDGWVLALEEEAERPGPEPAWKRTPWKEEPPSPRRGVALRLRFEGASPAAVTPEQRLGGVHHYFLGNDPERWRTDVPRFGAVRLSGLYPGIDACLREHQGHLEYDLLLAPGADLEQVVMHLEGADRLTLAADGTLVAHTALGPLRQPRPTTWQVAPDGTREPLACDYVLLGPDRFGFVAPGWAGDLALVVDPGLIWSTLVGGNTHDYVADLVVEPSGIVTIAGNTESADYPWTPGAWDTTHNNPGAPFNQGKDVFITQLDPSLPGVQQLVYSTFIGGSDYDVATSLAVDAAGVVTFAGYTRSGDYPPTPGAWNTTHNSPQPGGNGIPEDAIATRLDPSLPGVQQLVYSTFIGGSLWEKANAVAVDAAGVITIAGTTGDWGGGPPAVLFPTTPGAWDTTYDGISEIFVSRLDPALPQSQQLVYSTYVGEYAQDEAYDMHVDSMGVITVVGLGASGPLGNYPTTPGAFASGTFGVGCAVTRLDPSLPAAQQLLYSTCFNGGSGTGFGTYIAGTAVAVDAAGVITVVGNTDQPLFPTTSGALIPNYPGISVAGFVTRLDPSLSGQQQLLYSTFIGGSFWDSIGDLAVDPTGVVTLVGAATSADYPTTPGAFSTTLNGPEDAFVTRLDPSQPPAQQLIYSTFVGGAGAESSGSLAITGPGTLVIAGRTSSAIFPTTPGAFDTTPNGGNDVFVTHLDLGTTIGLTQPGGPGTPITIDNGYLIPGNEYYNIFSLDLCPTGPGTGPYLGLCATTLPNVQFLVLQASLPVGSPPFHFMATASTASWGPYAVGPGTLDALCLDVTGGVLGSYSPVTRITIQ